ncbi:T9SS type A sorting domain-containing protein, partial [Rufibacter psychrotolerans]|uniref:T9SS type A sorting domain-containing protein n=1 Tax=Rufibacter psychrotolerans TaxID=2812556 RepID=UPI0019679342
AGSSYSVTARVKGTTCVSAARTGTIGTQPQTAAQPTVSVTHPTCEVATGSLTVTSPLDGGGVDYEYSLNGGAFTDQVTFSALAAGSSYSVTARVKGTTCVSAARTGTIGTQPQTPSAPTLVPTQPTCSVLTGSISISSTTTGLTFSLNNGPFVAYPSGGFTGLTPGTYTVRARNAAECTSGYASVTLVAATNCVVNEGCTLGYWKNHTNRWACYSPNTLYGSVFTDAPTQLRNLTLLQVLNMGGGGIYNLGRQSVAALLNICHPDVDYNSAYPTITSLKTAVNAAFRSGSTAAGNLASKLDRYNNAGCPLGGSSATTVAYSVAAPEGQAGETNSEIALSANPNPFSDQASVEFTLREAGQFSLVLYDVSGKAVRRLGEGRAEAGVTYKYSIDSEVAEGIYIARLNTERRSKAIRIMRRR